MLPRIAVSMPKVKGKEFEGTVWLTVLVDYLAPRYVHIRCLDCHGQIIVVSLMLVQSEMKHLDIRKNSEGNMDSAD